MRLEFIRAGSIEKKQKSTMYHFEIVFIVYREQTLTWPFGIDSQTEGW